MGRFQLVRDKKAADLIFLLSADPYRGGYIIFASGQTGTMGADGHVHIIATGLKLIFVMRSQAEVD